MKTIRRVIIFSGRVQGVGFRLTACELARSFALSGTVRNLSDGGVELIAEGAAAEIDALQQKLRERFAGFILDVQQHDAPAQGLTGPIRVMY